MKKLITIIFVLFSITAMSQTVSTRLGVVGILDRSNNYGWRPVSFIAVEPHKNFGLEYGHSWDLNTNVDDLNNYIFGNTTSYNVGYTSNLISLYYKTDFVEQDALKVGLGSSLTTHYSASDKVNINTVSHPYFYIGYSKKVNKKINLDVTTLVGKLTSLSFGISLSL